MHIFAAPDIPLRCGLWPQHRYYLSIGCAIVLEDVVISLYSKLTKFKVTKVSNEVGDNISSKATDSHAPKGSGKRVKPSNRIAPEAKSLSTQNSQRPSEPPRTAFYAIGFLWVACFEVWSISKLIYGTEQCLSS